jgi:hypothetical protein
MTTMGGQAPGATQLRSLGRVGLWGAPGTGKTTFLAALNIAVQRSAIEDLTIFGTDDVSTDFLADSTARLTRDRRFPEATGLADNNEYSWIMRMTTQVPEKKRMKTRLVNVPLELNLDLIDRAGRVFGDGPGEGGAAALPSSGANLGYDDDDPAETESPGYGAVAGEDDVMDQLASCDGLVVLFDPTREWRDGDAYNYFQRALLKIAQRRMLGGPGARLPQYVAVCVTKFDDPDVYKRARTRGYASYSADDPALFPRVPDSLAEKFFADLVRESKRGNAELIGNALRKFFYPERVQFFVTSAIGFYKSPRAARFQGSDPMNIVRQENGDALIRGPIHPINVVEPLIWVGRSLASTPGSGR